MEILLIQKAEKEKFTKQKKIIVRGKPKIRRRKLKYTTLEIKGLNLSTK